MVSLSSSTFLFAPCDSCPGVWPSSRAGGLLDLQELSAPLSSACAPHSFSVHRRWIRQPHCGMTGHSGTAGRASNATELVVEWPGGRQLGLAETWLFQHDDVGDCCQSPSPLRTLAGLGQSTDMLLESLEQRVLQNIRRC
ncbi:uncharacterized protein LY89DRAFT_508875 [Mollisia scopiformis]|uniref:Uncharacterized protein n=1 Tax=Mollisia scopiformis TaxID=149040 RepID=A0A194XFM9_MOLSC|nr:uncharacterized protein LY89DRAFT_508875 [Mollisia scopiformis]KUJ18973.1 hypothetical protein LY89DRAFT_508875 [Mollisia scopiformis]